jgi:hypothetical protein
LPPKRALCAFVEETGSRYQRQTPPHIYNTERRSTRIAIPTIAPVAAAPILAPMAHADASGHFLNCLTENGIVITNAANAINLGRRIQNDEMNNLPRNQIIWNLVNLEL